MYIPNRNHIPRHLTIQLLYLTINLYEFVVILYKFCLNPLQSLHGEIFHPHSKFLIVKNSTEMTGFHLWFLSVNSLVSEIDSLHAGDVIIMWR